MSKKLTIDDKFIANQLDIELKDGDELSLLMLEEMQGSKNRDDRGAKDE